MGIGKLTIFDNDVINPENLATQLHKLSDVGMFKVVAVKDMVREFSDDTDISFECECFDYQTQIKARIIISAVDSINARKHIWASVSGGESDCRWYLDARMSAEQFHLYAVDMRDAISKSKYDEMLAYQNDEDIADEPCTSKATIYCAFVAAGLIGAAVKQIITNTNPSPHLVFNVSANFFMAEQ